MRGLPSLAGWRPVIATGNRDKWREIAALLAGRGIRPAAGEVLAGVTMPAETACDFAGNAFLKARAACTYCALPALGDDSGLEVAALNGRPGVHSARFAGPERDFAAAHKKLLREMENSANPDRRARFVCAVCLVFPGGAKAAFSGCVEGRIVWPPRGRGGFGYDPIFQPDGHARTFAEMSAAQKQQLSHRARAFARLADALDS